MQNPKIAILTAFIGNGGQSGELCINAAAKTQLEDYGVDVYRFNNDNIELLKPYIEPLFSKNEVINEKIWDNITYSYLKLKYRQKIQPTKTDNYTRLIAKIPKILFYKLIPNDYDYYIWLDSKFTIQEYWLNYVLWIIQQHQSSDIITSLHSERSSMKQEVKAMLKYLQKSNKIFCEKYYTPDILKQYYAYKNQITDNRLFELTMIIYSKSILEKKNFLDKWYAHNYYYTIQDQLSFLYLLEECKINIWGIPQYVFNMPFTNHEYGLV